MRNIHVRPTQVVIAVLIVASVLLGISLLSWNHPITLSQSSFWIPSSSSHDVTVVGELSSVLIDSGIENTPFPLTIIPEGAHVDGFTIFDNLYLRNGTLYVLTPDLLDMPSREALLSAPLDQGSDDMTPNDTHLQFISPDRAVDVLGAIPPLRMDEFTAIVYDTSQFVHHFYHWWGEIILGFWRVYSILDLKNNSSAGSSLEFPSRFMLPFVEGRSWRDRAGVIGPIMRAANPSISIEMSEQWEDFIALDRTVVFKRVALINRRAAHMHRLGNVWFKMIAGTMSLNVPNHFWEPLRRKIVKNLVGFVPELNDQGMVLSPSTSASSRPVVVYISRQGGGRRLPAEDHELLVQNLQQLDAEDLCEVHVVALENMKLRAQVEVVSRATVVLGVHGNGLTHQLWMPPSPLSTVIEIVIPEGYTYDYEILARNVGHQHYIIWNDTSITYPQGTTHEGVKYPQGFHSDSIPLHGPTVAAIIRERLGYR